MNLCYMDELLWHFNWTGDTAYVRKMWPVITRHLAWEKLNYDPTMMVYMMHTLVFGQSDALYYNSGAVTHSSAYNYRANKMAAFLASLIGEDPSPYQNEAEQILKAMNKRLWMQGKGCWAEYQDFMGHRRLHESPGYGLYTMHSIATLPILFKLIRLHGMLIRKYHISPCMPMDWKRGMQRLPLPIGCLIPGVSIMWLSQR